MAQIRRKEKRMIPHVLARRLYNANANGTNRIYRLELFARIRSHALGQKKKYEEGLGYAKNIQYVLAKKEIQARVLL